MKNVSNMNNFIRFFIIFLTSFLLGIIFALNVAKIIDINSLKILDKNTITSIVKNDKDLDLKRFWEVYELIKYNNYNSNWIKKDDLVNSAIKWLVEWLWDKHSEYMSPDETSKFNNILSWDFEWIGAVVEKNILWVVIDRIIKWSPAKKFWLISWDIIIKANGEDLSDLELYNAVEKIKWPAWTSVILDVLRKWEKDILTINVIRDKIKIPSVDFKIFEDSNLGYISINIFGLDTSSEFEKALKEVEKTQGLIIDLRDNWWWYLQSAVEILGNLIEDWKVIVITKYKNDYFNTVYKSVNIWELYNKKIVVLINENSASASEITAWALSDHNKAIIVWKKSYWKWSVQKPFDLEWWSLLKLTIAKWFTPNDSNIDKEWINPDIEVTYEKEDFENKYDRQLEEAKEVLKDFIKIWALKLVIDKYNKEKE